MAFRGIDLRDLYRPGSGLTPRRLFVLLGRLVVEDAVLNQVLVDAEKLAEMRSRPDEIRKRKAAFEARNERARGASE